MTPEQFNLVRQAAIKLLAHRDAGHKCDPEAARWAKDLLMANPLPKVKPVEGEANK